MKNKKLRRGDVIFFHGENLPYVIRAISKRFAVVVRNFDKEEDFDVLEGAESTGAYCSVDEAFLAYKDEVIYSLLDFKEQEKSTVNLVFSIYDFSSVSDCEECLKDLISGKVSLSARNGVDLLIDHEETAFINRNVRLARKAKKKLIKETARSEFHTQRGLVKAGLLTKFLWK